MVVAGESPGDLGMEFLLGGSGGCGGGAVGGERSTIAGGSPTVATCGIAGSQRAGTVSAVVASRPGLAERPQPRLEQFSGLMAASRVECIGLLIEDIGHSPQEC